MARILPPAVAILAALWLVRDSYSLGHYRKSRRHDLYFDASPSDSSESVSTVKVPDNLSYGRGIHHSAWSKEEKETLTSNSDENDPRERWVKLFFPDLRKFFQAIVSFLHKNDSSEKMSNPQTETTENYESQSTVSSSLNIDKSKNDATLLPHKRHEVVNKDVNRNIELEGRSGRKKGNDNDCNYEAEEGDDDGHDDDDDDNDDDIDDDNDDNDDESNEGDSGDKNNESDDNFDDENKNIEKSLKSQTSKLDGNDSDTTNSTKQTILDEENYKVHPVISLNDTGGNLNKNEFKSPAMTNEQKLSQKSELIDDYINNHNQNTPEAGNVQQPNNINSTDQVISDQRNNKVKTLIPQNDNDGKLRINESNSFTVANGQKPSGKSELIEREFTDDYIKNQNQNISAAESNQQSSDMNSTTQVVSDQHNYKTETLITQNNNDGQLNTDLHKSLTTTKEHKPSESFELTGVDFINGYIKSGDQSAPKIKHDQEPTNKMLANQAISNQQNYKVQSVLSQYDSEDKLIDDLHKPLTITNRHRPSQNSGLIAEEFIDDYINNRRQSAPEQENDHLKKSTLLIPKLDEKQRERILIPVPFISDTFQKENKLLNSTLNPIYQGGVKDQFMILDQIKNEKEIFRSESYIPHTSLYKAYAEDIYSNQKPMDKKPSENTFISADKHVLYGQENGKSYESTSVKPIPFQQEHEIHFPTQTLQKHYNTNTEPKTQNYQNNENVEKTVDKESHMSSYKQKIMNSTPLLPTVPLHFQKDDHNYSEQYGRYSGIEMTNGQQAEKTKLDSKHSTIYSTVNQNAPARNLPSDADKHPSNLDINNPENVKNQSTDEPTNVPKSVANVSATQPLISENPPNTESTNLTVSNDSEPLSEDDSDGSDESDYSDETSSSPDEDEIEYDRESENSSNSSNAIAENLNSTREQLPQSTSFTNINYSTGIPTISKTETRNDETPKLKETFNTILEYIYKFSNNSFFKGLGEENSGTM